MMMATVVDKNICLVLLVGLPASGKTYLASFLVNHLRVNNFDSSKYLSDLFILPITYDDYICYNNANDLKDWKQRRRNIFLAVEEFILYCKGCKSTLKHRLFINNFIDCNKSNVIIIIDDNMYYKSMRYEYFQLAKKYEIGFCQIYLEATLDKALEYNIKRDAFVPEFVIKKMYNLIEIPNLNSEWERNSVIFPAYVDLHDGLSLDRLYEVIKIALDTPIKLKNEQDVRMECRKITDNNVIHQLDKRLRSVIGCYVQQAKKSKSVDIKSTALLLNSNKVKLMKSVKSGEVILPSDVIKSLQPSYKIDEDNNVIDNYFINILTDKTF